MAKIENLVDEGFRVSLVETAFFDGDLEIPHIDAPKEIIIPSGMVPFSKRNRGVPTDFMCFYENDINFRDVLTKTEELKDDLGRFAGIISPDCSLYIDAPLIVQLADIYLNRAVGYYYSNQGLYVVPNVRWGDERTYTDEIFGAPPAFLGVEKNSIVSIGTYGQIKAAESKKYFREGLVSMLDLLSPQVVLVYGPMNKKIFEGLSGRTCFVQFDDWTTRQHIKANFIA